MVRLVFRPYTQFRRQRFARQFLTTQASIKFSPDFTMSENSSPSFGSQQKCSVAQPLLYIIFFFKKKRKKYKALGHWLGQNQCSWLAGDAFFFFKKKKKKRLTISYFRYAVCIFLLKIYIATTHTPVELLRPCYKTGRTVVSHSLTYFWYVS